MATIVFEDFGGIAPGIAAARLPDNAALEAHNCRLKSGRLEPLHEPEKDTRRVNFEGGIDEISDAKTIYLWHKGEGESEWIAWGGKVSVAPSNLAIDKNSRLFVTGETGYGEGGKEPVMFFAREFGYTKYPMIKQPLPKPSVKLTGEIKDENNLRYTYFFQTWVDRYGYESPVSEPSNELEYTDGKQVKLDGFAMTDNYPNIAKRRVYKVVTGTETESIQFVAEQDITGTLFLDMYFRVKDEDAGEVLTQIEAPPIGLDNILWMPGGFYAGVDRANSRTVCFSDVNLPYSWPNAFQYTVKDDIVGIALIGNTLAVLTNGSPWIISGTAPEAMSAMSLSSPHACVSADSICALGGTVYYASHMGICAITEGSNAAQVLTTNWFTKEAWKALRPETCRMVAHDQALFFWVTAEDDTTQGYILDFDAGNAVKAVTTHSEPAGCIFEDVESGALCYVRRNG